MLCCLRLSFLMVTLIKLVWCMQMLEKILDRKHLAEHKAAPYPDVGVGYEIVHHAEGSGESTSFAVPAFIPLDIALVALQHK